MYKKRYSRRALIYIRLDTRSVQERSFSKQFRDILIVHVRVMAAQEITSTKFGRVTRTGADTV